ncbi:hypothetical protein GCM10011610_00550 [Nocardia rhizosphaerihabitans]|uniref:Uncharacterized protein n=1 Tax=Nocardia rhizosphaerihabitans TaxID=1691570 RepID=A0ABQ2K4Y1_9NOCA|nr:hypothetical protein GCM10011610_00550 [Nocardia rhizosphaerihabitans]
MVGRTVVDPCRLYGVRGGWAEAAPQACGNGHPLRRNAMVGSVPCGQHGHYRSCRCCTCGHEIIWPTLDEACRTPH